MESCPSGRRCSTRNAVWGNSPRVRIPNSPPEKSDRFRLVGFFIQSEVMFSRGDYVKDNPLMKYSEQLAVEIEK